MMPKEKHSFPPALHPITINSLVIDSLSRPLSAVVLSGFFFSATSSACMRMKRVEQSCFFTILLADFSQRLSIPSEFLANLKSKLPETVELRNAAGRQWRVRVRINGSTIFLEEGWREFAMAESLQLGDFLLFKFDRKRCFRVLTFGPNGCEKWDAPASDEARTIQKKRSRPTTVSAEKTEKSQKRICSREMKTEGKKRERSKLLVMKEEREKALRFAVMSPESTKKSMKRRCSREMKTERKKRKRSELLVMKEEKERARTLATMSPERTKKSKKRSCSGEMKTEIEKRETSELLVVSPNRFPVMREERERALSIAATLELSCPAFLSVVKPSHLSAKCSMRVPRQFADEFLGGERRKMILRCPDDEWEMSYRVLSGRCYCFTAGWKRFASENGLQVGDALVFELVNRRSSVLRFNVRIFPLHEKLPLLARSLETSR